MTHDEAISKMLGRRLIKKHYDFLINYNPDVCYTVLAKKSGFSYSSIHGMIEEYGLKHRDIKKARRSKRRKYDKPETQYRLNNWDEKLTLEQLADKFGVSVTTCWNLAKDKHLEFRRLIPEKREMKLKRDRIKTLVRQGIRLQEIARYIGISRERVRQIVEGV